VSKLSLGLAGALTFVILGLILFYIFKRPSATKVLTKNVDTMRPEEKYGTEKIQEVEKAMGDSSQILTLMATLDPAIS
jgi:hypothetical protein